MTKKDCLEKWWQGLKTKTLWNDRRITCSLTDTKGGKLNASNASSPNLCPTPCMGVNTYFNFVLLFSSLQMKRDNYASIPSVHTRFSVCHLPRGTSLKNTFIYDYVRTAKPCFLSMLHVAWHFLFTAELCKPFTANFYSTRFKTPNSWQGYNIHSCCIQGLEGGAPDPTFPNNFQEKPVSCPFFFAFLNPIFYFLFWLKKIH